MTPQIPVRFHPDAITEAAAARQWYAERDAQAADAFQVEIDRAVEAISEAPSRSARHGKRTRRFVLHRFPFVLVYVELPEGPLIIAVAHGKRRPGYWRARLGAIPRDRAR